VVAREIQEVSLGHMDRAGSYAPKAGACVNATRHEAQADERVDDGDDQ